MANRTKRSPKKEEKFLLHLAKTGNVTAACEVIGICRRTPYEWRDGCDDFARAWDSAVEIYVDTLEAEADRRAAQGVEQGVYFQGKRVAGERKYSDNLLMFRLKALRPEKYRDNAKLDVSGTVEVRKIERVIVDPDH